ncbi:high mobility group b protein 7 [Phtheirospermum japonicum]|uniref:High mobility group b protein 7 n=1 Tax=Phtheirospermum japonicum TaxID=374723 RepID=A0A830C310_9LAMI|nr:high mobility group b protein 7 [Phtheirospermum japonicum]
MAGGGGSSNASRLRKRVEADTTSPSSLKRARDGSAFAKCDECNKDVPVALISFHNCSLDAKIKMNLEAQVVEMPAEAKKKPATEKKRIRKTEPNPKKGKSAKDPNKPKRPATAFFVFMEDFRKSFKESNPDSKGVAKVAKEGGEAWKSMSDEEKKVYIDKAAELKAEYEKAMEEYNEVEDEQEADDSSEKEVKDEVDVDDESEKEVKEEAEKEVKEEELEDDDV